MCLRPMFRDAISCSLPPLGFIFSSLSPSLLIKGIFWDFLKGSYKEVISLNPCISYCLIDFPSPNQLLLLHKCLVCYYLVQRLTKLFGYCIAFQNNTSLSTPTQNTPLEIKRRYTNRKDSLLSTATTELLHHF